ncbi:hypothetical protein ACFSUK_33625 [Sphingobium scionense]
MPGDSVFTVRTLGDQVIAGAGDATRSIGLNTQPFTVNGVNYGGGGNSWFSLWTDHTAINLQSAGGDIAPGKHGIETSQTLIAAPTLPTPGRRFCGSRRWAEISISAHRQA